jgi:hypothetical protein
VSTDGTAPVRTQSPKWFDIQTSDGAVSVCDSNIFRKLLPEGVYNELTRCGIIEDVTFDGNGNLTGGDGRTIVVVA